MQRALFGVVLLGLCAALVGCDPPTSTRTLTLPRAVFAAGSPPDDAERLQPAPLSFVYTVPQGWEERPPQEFRQVNLRLAPPEPGAPQPHVECYLTRLPNSAAGVLMNVNRWRKQMGQDPVDDATVSGYPTAPLLGASAVVVDLQGDYTDGHGGHAGYTLLGWILPWGRDALFVKAVGPSAEIDAERARIGEFLQSLRVKP